MKKPGSGKAKLDKPRLDKRIWALACQLEAAKKEFINSSHEFKANNLRKLIRLTKQFNELALSSQPAF